MKMKIILLSICMLFSSTVSFGTIQTLAADELQIINRSSVAVSFETSENQEDWVTRTLGSNKSLLIKLKDRNKPFILRLCTNLKNNSTPSCKKYKLKSETRYEVDFDYQKGIYTLEFYKEH